MKDNKLKQKNEQNNNLDYIISILAHDFSTVIGFTEIALEDLKKSDYDNLKEYLLTIKKHAKIANRQILSLAEWGYDFQNKIDNYKKFDISKLIDRLIENHTELAKEKNIELVKQLDFKPTKILGNKQAVEIILRNLISNAIKFTGKNGKIEILGFKNNDTIEIVVKDNGIGIEQSQIDKIFEKVEPKFGTSNEKGFGIGLSLCKQIINNLNEKIWFVTEKGKGTEFHFTISQKIINFETNG